MTLKHTVAVVGSGPAAFYAAQRALRSGVHVDIYEKLPVPYGLSRFGVAPDHPEVKNCQDRFHEVAEHPDVRFFGNVEVGADIAVPQLFAEYNAVLFAYGSQLDNGLAVPGADHPGVVSARKFVSWYNGEPAAQHPFSLEDVERVAIIGNGNVALDVARLLLKDPREMTSTDITSTALKVLEQTHIKHVSIVGRRNLMQSSFTTKELRELIHCAQFEPCPEIDELLPFKKLMGRAEKRKLDLLAKRVEVLNGKSWSLEFLRSPIEFVPRSNTRLAGIRYVRNQLAGPVDAPRAEPTEETFFEPCDMAFTSIGYRGHALPGLERFFDERSGVLRARGSHLGENAFATGWIKTGPRGVIASTMMDAYSAGEEVAKWLQETAPEPKALVEPPTNATNWEGWQRINAREVELGQGSKPREKIVSVDEMLKVANCI